MKAMLLTGLRQMEMREVPAPEIIADNDVLIRMKSVGVCGSDVHYYTWGRIGSQIVKYPFIVGHEGAGIVEAVGKAVTRVKPGTRIAIEPGKPCRQCDQCRIGRHHTCRKLKYLGCPGQAEGCLSEYIVMPQESCFPIPDRMTLEEAAISEPLSIGVYAVRLSVPMQGAKIAILGAGPIGFSVMMSARALGAAKIYVTDKIDERLKLVSAAGADWTGNPLKTDVTKAVTDHEPLMADAVFECCGDQNAVDQAVELVKPGGKIMMIGIPECERISFNVDKMRHKEICVQNVRRQNHCVQAAIDMIASGAVNAGMMATHRFPLEKTPEAFELVTEYRDGVLKAMIEIN